MDRCKQHAMANGITCCDAVGYYSNDISRFSFLFCAKEHNKWLLRAQSFQSLQSATSAMWRVQVRASEASSQAPLESSQCIQLQIITKLKLHRWQNVVRAPRIGRCFRQVPQEGIHLLVSICVSYRLDEQSGAVLRTILHHVCEAIVWKFKFSASESQCFDPPCSSLALWQGFPSFCGLLRCLNHISSIHVCHLSIDNFRVGDTERDCFLEAENTLVRIPSSSVSDQYWADRCSFWVSFSPITATLGIW